MLRRGWDYLGLSEGEPNAQALGLQTAQPVAVVGSTTILESQTLDPTVTVQHSSPPSTGWIQSYSDQATITGRDAGLGMGSVSLTGPGVPNGTTTQTSSGTGTFGNIVPTYPTTPSPISYTAPEGVDNYMAEATDVVGNAAPPVTWTARVDDTAPTTDLSGDLRGARDATITGPSYAMNVDATDRGPEGAQTSGVQKIVIKVDPDSAGNSPYPVITQTNTGCTATQCPQEMVYSWTMQSSVYGDGEHTVEIDTTDLAGNTDTETVPVTLVHVDQLAPQTVSLPIAGSPQITGPAGSQFGASVANVGDVTGSGYQDLLVGAPAASCDGRSDVGAAYLILGSTNTAPINVSVPDPRVITFCGASTGDQTGISVAAGGDVNGDGYPDLLIGAPGTATLGIQPQGRVYVIFGGPNLQSMDLSNFASETQTNTPGAGFLIKGPALSTNINVGLGHPAPVAFGASLGNQNVGDYSTSSDFNGDGLDDIVIGDSGDSSSLRLGGGTVWVIYGKKDGGTVDLSATGGATQDANQLNPTVNTGVRIFGADLLDEAGQATAWPGSVDGSGNASLVITAPGLQNPQAPNLLAPAGGAYVIFGGNYSGDLDLAKLNQPGGPTGYRIYGPAGANIASTAPLGDVDGDGTPDILLGGNNAAWVVTGQNSTSDIYLNSTYTGYQITAPDSTYGPAQVAGVGDIDGDNAPDTLISFPQSGGGSGSSFVVYGRPALTNVSLDPNQGFGADQGTRLNGPAGSATGTSADGIDGDMSPNALPAVAIGQPGANAVTLAGAPTLAGPPTIQPITTSGTLNDCQPSNTWTYPFASGSTGALPVCRLAAHGTADHALVLPIPQRVPYNGKVSIFRHGNARVAMATLSSGAVTNGLIPVVDSLGNVFANIKYENLGCFDVYDARGTTLLGETVAADDAGNPLPGYTCSSYQTQSGPMRVDVSGRGCMATKTAGGTPLDGTLPNAAATYPPGYPTGTSSNHDGGWVLMQFQEAQGDQAAYQGLEGFIPFDDVPTKYRSDPPAGKGGVKYQTDYNQAYPGCGGTLSDFKTQVKQMGRIPSPQTTLNDVFTSPNEWFRTSNPNEVPDPMWRNQEIPGVPGNEGMFFDSTSATVAGDFVRGILPKGTTFTELDYMAYPDPNGWCWDRSTGVPWQQGHFAALSVWVFGELTPPGAGQGMFGWFPYHQPNAPSC
jgi:hypothetical protein